MRISDWSSDVCSSDLTIVFEAGIKESDVAVDHSARGMVLRLNDGQQIISGWTAARGHSVERIEFANGTVWNTATLSTQANRAPTVSTAIVDQKVAEERDRESKRLNYSHKCATRKPSSV